MGSTAVLLTAAVAVGSPSTRSGVQKCMNEHRARCAALETGLQRFMVDHMLQNVVIVGRMHRGDTHRWIHYGLQQALQASAPPNTTIQWLSGDPHTSLPPPHSLVVTTLVSQPHVLAAAPADPTSRYILLMNEGKDAYAQNAHWITNVTAVLWAPYLPVTPNHENGCLLEPWPGPATRCAVVTPECITAELDRRKAAEAAGEIRHAVFVGTLWKKDQVDKFVTVVSALKDRHNISTIQYGRCEPCSANKSFAASRGFEARGILSTDDMTAINDAFLTFDLRYDYHLRNGYVPDRWFKLAAHGKLVATNSPHAAAVLRNSVVADTNVTRLVDRAVALLTDYPRLERVLNEAAAAVRSRHTYADRIRTLLTLFPHPS